MKLTHIWSYFSKDAIPLGYLKESLIALSFNVGGILAGFIVASQFNVFQLSPWAIAIYPAILTARGVVSGLFSGRLSTALHLGTIYPRFRGNTDEFYLLFKSVIVLTLETSVIMSSFSIALGILFWGVTFTDFFNILIVVLATMFLGLLNSLFTILFSFTSFRRGLDTDVVVYPIMSTVADIIITLSYVFTLSLFFLFSLVGKCIVVSLGLLLVTLALVFLPRCIKSKSFIKTIKESLLTLFFVAFIVNVTGTVLKGVDKIVRSGKEIYIVYPALIDTVGDVGSVIGSTATTKLAVGLLSSIISLLTQGMLTAHMFLRFSALLITTNLIAVIVIVLVSFYIAILTFRRGLDPDNFVIPIESSLADGITTFALLIALFLVNYGIIQM